MKYLTALIFAMTLILAGSVKAKPPRHAFTLDQLVDIKFPSASVWSPNGRRVAFVWDNGGVYDLFAVNADGQGQPVQLTSYSPASDAGAPDENELSGGFWSPDSQTFYYSYQGHLWKVEATGGTPQPAWTASGPEGDFVPSPDGARVAFVRPSGKQRGQGSDLIVRSLARGTESRVAHNPHGIFGIAWSPGGKHLVYSGGSQSILHRQIPPYVGHKLSFLVTEHTPPTLYVVPSSGGRSVRVSMPGARRARWIDETHLVFQRESKDYKRRMIYIVGITGGAPRIVHEDIEPKFWSMPYDVGDGPQPSPDGRWIAFLSDTDGWDHVYVMPASGGAPVKITKGHFVAWRPKWSHDSTRIAFDANSPGKPGDRQLGIAAIGSDPAHATVTFITEGRGTNIAPKWSPDDKQIVYQHTDPENSADLFAIDASAGAKPVRLTESMPTGIDHSAFVAPRLVHYPGAHGQPVPAWLFVPRNLDRSKRHAAIVWVHGDGVNQNYDGWHVQRHYSIYYAIHQYLLQEGYVVLAPDYRGSIGYGRAWRTGVYDSVGVDDEEDVAKAADYLKTLPYVDPSRMGIWGLSYGGFFTLQTVTEHPTLFRAAVDVAGVADFGMYYEDPYHSTWIASRLNGSPAQNPTGYADAAPVNHVARLQRPLLILAGTADFNVPFLETVRIVDQFLKHGKGNLLTFMMYPGEFHYFNRAYVLRDAWHRVDDFFRENLHPETAGQSGGSGMGTRQSFRYHDGRFQ